MLRPTTQQEKRQQTHRPLPALLLDRAFEECAKPKIGVEIELTIVDAKTGSPRPLFHQLLDLIPRELRDKFHAEFLLSQVELVTSPCSTVRELRDELMCLTTAAEDAASRLGAQLLWRGLHPTWKFNPSLIHDSDRTRHNLRRFGPLSRQLSTCGVHFHVGVARDHAIQVVDGFQRFIPLLVALASNSAIAEGRPTGRRSERAAIWTSGFPVCGLCGPYRDWDGFRANILKLTRAGRIQAAKDIYNFVRPTTHGTVEIRCCDTPPTVTHVVALAALVQTLVVSVAESPFPSLSRDSLDAELFESVQRGPDAMLIDHRGRRGTPMQWLHTLARDMNFQARRLQTDGALAWAATVLGANGSTEQLYFHSKRNPMNTPFLGTNGGAFNPQSAPDDNVTWPWSA